MVKPISDNPYESVPGDADSKMWRLRFGLIQSLVKDLEAETKSAMQFLEDLDKRLMLVEMIVGTIPVIEGHHLDIGGQEHLRPLFMITLVKDEHASTEETIKGS